MWAYAQYNPNKGQEDLIKSNSPTSAHQLAPAPLRHAKDLTVMRQATQLIPWPPPLPNHGGWRRRGGLLLLCYHPIHHTALNWANSSTLSWPQRQWVLAKAMCKHVTLAYFLVVMSCSYILEHKKWHVPFDRCLFKKPRCFKCHIHEERKRTGAQTVWAVWLYWLKALMYSFIHICIMN